MKLDKKRRLKNKTNYRKRINLLKGNSLRLVVRKTDRFIILQVIESKNACDKIIHSSDSRELLKHGWPKENSGSLKSIPAAYLTGILLGKKSKGLKESLILDLGLIPNTKGSRIYAAVKGVHDSGIKIKFDEKIIPSKERIEGKDTKIKNIFEKVYGSLK
jgi:large subunit ribosomal protein L18